VKKRRRVTAIEVKDMVELGRNIGDDVVALSF
jgi:hypothetical protein